MEAKLKPKIVLLCGLPGSGKTTYRNDFLAEWCGYMSLSSDDFIHYMAEQLGQTYEEVFKDSVNLATRLLMKRYEEYVHRRDYIIIDRTNLTPKARAQFSPLGYDRYAVNFFTQYKSVRFSDYFCCFRYFIPVSRSGIKLLQSSPVYCYHGRIFL